MQAIMPATLVKPAPHEQRAHLAIAVEVEDDDAGAVASPDMQSESTGAVLERLLRTKESIAAQASSTGCTQCSRLVVGRVA